MGMISFAHGAVPWNRYQYELQFHYGSVREYPQGTYRNANKETAASYFVQFDIEEAINIVCTLLPSIIRDLEIMAEEELK